MGQISLSLNRGEINLRGGTGLYMRLVIRGYIYNSFICLNVEQETNWQVLCPNVCRNAVSHDSDGSDTYIPSYSV